VPAATQASKPAAGSLAKRAAAQPVPAKPAAAEAKAAVKPTSASEASQNNRLERVNVVRNGDDIQIEIGSREAVTPRVSKLSSPARVVVELPATAMATSQNKIPVGSAGVKGVRIGMDGKTPPTTSVVVDLEQACGYELKQGTGNKLVLTLHTQAVAVSKSTPAPVLAKPSAPAAKPQTAAAKPVVAAPAATPQAAKVAAAGKAAAPKAAAPTKAATTAVAAPK